MARRGSALELVKDLNVSIVLLSVWKGSRVTAKSPRTDRPHRFLRALRWLSDVDPDFNAMSIAIQAEPGFRTFWITGNQNPTSTTAEHLKWILATLRNCSLPNLKAKIFSESTTKAYRKVKKDVRRMDLFISRLVSSKIMALPSGELGHSNTCIISLIQTSTRHSCPSSCLE